MEASLRVLADGLQEPRGRDEMSVELVYDDERSAAVRRERSLSLQARVAWEFLYVRLAHRMLATVIVTANDIAADIRGSSRAGLRLLHELKAIGLIRLKEYNRHSGAWTIEIVDPFEVGIGRLTRVGDEQAELDFGSCSAAHAERSTDTGEAPVANAMDAFQQSPSRAFTTPPPQVARQTRPPPAATCGDQVATSGDTNGDLQQSNLSKSSKKLELSNLSNLSESRQIAALAKGVEVREVEAEKRVATNGDISGGPKPIGASLAGAIDRLMPTAADRTREIGGVLNFLRDVVGDDVRSVRPLTTIAEAVADRRFPQTRLAEVCATYRREKKAGRIRCEPGWYFLCSIDQSARQIGLHLKLTGSRAPKKPR
jgi:hypothetical protein